MVKVTPWVFRAKRNLSRDASGSGPLCLRDSHDCLLLRRHFASSQSKLSLNHHSLSNIVILQYCNPFLLLFANDLRFVNTYFLLAFFISEVALQPLYEHNISKINGDTWRY